jgi:hypothetical protein
MIDLLWTMAQVKAQAPAPSPPPIAQGLRTLGLIDG